MSYIVRKLFYQKLHVNISRKSFIPRFYSQYFLTKKRNQVFQLTVNYDVILFLKEVMFNKV